MELHYISSSNVISVTPFQFYMSQSLALDERKCVTCDTLLVTKANYFELLPICHEIRLMALVYRNVLFYCRYKNTLDKSCMETKLGRMEAFCSLTGVTSLTDLPDRSKLANCKNEMIESKSSKIHYQGINASSSISWGHVLQAVRNSSTGSYLIHVLCDKNCEVTSSSSFTWIQCIKRNSKLLCT